MAEPIGESGVPTGPVHAEPLGYHPPPVREQIIRSALAGVELGAWDERTITWLAGWDWATVATIVSWIERARTARREEGSRG